MTFMHVGLAIAGIASIAIPILIHLLMRRRRKPVMWGAMRFLVEAYRRQRRRLIVEKWLLLAIRCLVLLLIALALGRPLVGKLASGGGARSAFLLIDNSMTASVEVGGESALERHKRAAKSVLETLQSQTEGTRVGLVTLASPADALVVPPSSDLAGVAALIDAIEPTGSPADLATALREVETSADDQEGSQQVDVVVISDFRTGSADPTNALPALADGVKLLAAAPDDRSTTNVSIGAVQPLRPVVVTGDGGSGIAGEQVRIELVRTGAGVRAEQSTEVRAIVRAPDGEGNERRTRVRWSAGQTRATTTIQVGGRESDATSRRLADSAIIEVSISGDSLTTDDTWSRPVEVRQSLRVGVVAPQSFGGFGRIDELAASEWIRLALSPEVGGGVEVRELDPASLDRAQLSGLDALVLPRPDLIDTQLWNRIGFFVDQGGMLLVTPPTEVSVHVWTDAMTEALELDWTIAREASEFPRDAPATIELSETAAESRSLLELIEGELEDLASPVRVWRTLAVSDGTGRALLTTNDGGPLVWTSDHETGGQQGLVVYLAVALDLGWTDLPTKPLMVPLIQELFRQGIGEARGSWDALAGTALRVPDRTSRLRPATWASSGSRTFDVGEDGVLADPVRSTGVWEALDDRDGRRAVIAVNGDPAAGAVEVQDREVLSQWMGKSAGDFRWLEPDDTGRLGAAVSTYLGDREEGSPVSLPLLIGALILALIEVAVARAASHASIRSDASASSTPAGSIA